jgi:hypothetical protein
MPSAVPASWLMKATPPSRPAPLQAEDAGGDAAPGAAQAMQRPDAEHVVDLPAVLRQREHQTNKAAGNAAGDQRAQRMHQVRAGADRDQSGQRAVMHEAGVVPAGDQRHQRAADHGHQRVHGDEAGDLVQVCALMTLKPNQPTIRIQAPSARKGMLDGGCAEIRRPCDSARAARRAGSRRRGRPSRPPRAPPPSRRSRGTPRRSSIQPGLDAVGLVPGDALEEGIDEADQQEGGGELRAEARAFGDAAGDDGRDRRGEGQQEEELGQS